LRETVGTEAAVVATFDALRKKRNITGYERVGTCRTLMQPRCERLQYACATRSSNGSSSIMVRSSRTETFGKGADPTYADRLNNS
jgi:hypothetical protein